MTYFKKQNFFQIIKSYVEQTTTLNFFDKVKGMPFYVAQSLRLNKHWQNEWDVISYRINNINYTYKERVEKGERKRCCDDRLDSYPPNITIKSIEGLEKSHSLGSIVGGEFFYCVNCGQIWVNSVVPAFKGVNFVLKKYINK